MMTSEIFSSIQGEGLNIGKPAVFVRLSGCNLSCDFCDTKYAKHGKEMDVFEVADEIKKHKIKHVVWTGGEPTLQIKNIYKVMDILGNGYYHEIETNGTNFIEDFFKWNLINVSPKKEDIREDVLSKYATLNKKAFFKFVAESPDNFEFWHSLIKKIGIKTNNVIMMPEGIEYKTIKKKALWLVDKCKENNYRMCLRYQIWIWGKKKGV